MANHIFVASIRLKSSVDYNLSLRLFWTLNNSDIADIVSALKTPNFVQFIANSIRRIRWS